MFILKDCCLFLIFSEREREPSRCLAEPNPKLLKLPPEILRKSYIGFNTTLETGNILIGNTVPILFCSHYSSENSFLLTVNRVINCLISQIFIVYPTVPLFLQKLFTRKNKRGNN